MARQVKKFQPKKYRRAQQFMRGTEDGSGRLVIAVRRVGPDGKRVPGSVTKTVTVADAKVLEVFDVIEKALFGGA